MGVRSDPDGAAVVVHASYVRGIRAFAGVVGQSIRARHRPVPADDAGLARWAGTGANLHLPW